MAPTQLFADETTARPEHPFGPQAPDTAITSWPSVGTPCCREPIRRATTFEFHYRCSAALPMSVLNHDFVRLFGADQKVEIATWPYRYLFPNRNQDARRWILTQLGLNGYVQAVVLGWEIPDGRRIRCRADTVPWLSACRPAACVARLSWWGRVGV